MTVKDVSQSQLHMCYTVDLYFNHPQTKLQEGNAFTDICLSIGGSHAQQPLAMMHWISLYLLLETPTPPTTRYGTWIPTPATDI